MLPKSSRISRKEFPSNGGATKRSQSPHFSLSVTPSEKKEAGAKYSVVVSKKVAKNAVARNKLRRRVYAVLSAMGDKKRKGKHVVYAKKGAPELSYEELKREITTLL